MKVITFVLIALFVAGCAKIHVQPPMKQSFERSRTYPLPYEKVWDRAVDWFADHDVTIEIIEKPSGLLTAKYLINVGDNYLDCGNIKATGTRGDPIIDKYGSLNVTVRSIDQNTTKVSVNFFGEYTLTAYDLWDEHRISNSGSCVSTGELEKSILAYIGDNK
ncbi:MAG: hypothetical protein QF535_07300 [Anaerolineales bacterium]|jgi:hypothetical protein|nr:hypothetical protein [Anaerolineales bacterium]|tara:strand:- start:81 stop:566 length:486 start_codon:yes stop_codon:yes gene_type:complete